ncbi:MAG: DUF481 domain-containing protein [Kofleriaceae bacterium]|nr:DUF481 domain-containing protein [Kofleriaceae bacterium]MCL4225088.1 DUF481 domain-containing protein [Myxococcales bacterium]
MRHAVVTTLALAATLAVTGAPARAQIVNVQGSLAKEPAAGWTSSLTAGVDWQTGTVELVRLAGAGSAVYRAGPWLGLALVRGEYAEGAGVRLAEKTFEHVRGRRALGGRWRWEAFVQHEYDAFRRLAVRGVAGSGPAIRLVTRPRATLVGGVAYLLELEERSRLAGAADSGLRRWHHRLSSYLTGSLELGEQVTAGQTVYVQPRLDVADDLLLLSETSVTSKLGARLSLINSLVVAYDGSPPETVAALSTALKVSVAITF